MKLKDKTALITGASSGIGKATAMLFASEGANLALLGRNEQVLTSLQSDIENNGGTALATPADVTKEGNCRFAIKNTINRFGQLDVLVNAAGIIGSGSIETTTFSDWKNMLAINLDSVFMLTQLSLPYLEKTCGNIVNVSSVTGLRAFPNVLAYCVSKAAVDQFTRCTALELAAKGIRVNAVNPGVVVTELHKRGGMNETDYAAFLEHSKSTHPLGRVGQPDDIAQAILYLASDSAGWVTGETLSVDGGRQITCAR